MPLLCREGMRGICRGLLPGDAAALGSVPESPSYPCSKQGLGCAVTCRGYRNTTAKTADKLRFLFGVLYEIKVQAYPIHIVVMFPVAMVHSCHGSETWYICPLLAEIETISVPENCVSRKEIAYIQGSCDSYPFQPTVHHLWKKKASGKNEIASSVFFGSLFQS